MVAVLFRLRLILKTISPAINFNLGTVPKTDFPQE